MFCIKRSNLLLRIPGRDSLRLGSSECLQQVLLKKLKKYLLKIFSQTCVKQPLSKRPKMTFKTDNRLMQVKSIAKGSILQYFQPSLSYHLSLRPLFCLLLSGLFYTCFTVCLLIFRPDISSNYFLKRYMCLVWALHLCEAQTSLLSHRD